MRTWIKKAASAALLVVIAALVLWPSAWSPSRADVHLTVESVQMTVDPGASTLGCESLRLTPSEVSIYFSSATPASNEAFDAESLILPCRFNGTLVKEGERFAWQIQAGGAGYWVNQGTLAQQRFLCGDACKRLLPALMGE